jgi:hypothetical protein
MTPSGGRGLEIGAGTGRFAGPLEIRDGVDPSKRMRTIFGTLAETAEDEPVKHGYGEGSFAVICGSKEETEYLKCQSTNTIAKPAGLCRNISSGWQMKRKSNATCAAHLG